MSKRAAALSYNVPRSTVIYKINNPDSKDNPGPQTVLTKDEELLLVNWMLTNSEKGFPRRKDDLLESVKEFIRKRERQTPFKDQTPGNKWVQLFLKRHSVIAFRTPESVTSSSSYVSESDIRSWLASVRDFLTSQSNYDILQDPDRILNGDETNFQLCPKSGKAFALKGDKNVYEIDKGQKKSSMTVLFTFKANGKQTPPLIIYPNKRLPKQITESVPNEWGIGLSESGWMKTEIFMDYLKNVLHPFLVKTGTTFPVIMFVDGHKTHVTYGVSELCSELKIILIALYPHSTHILQPADVSAFKPLKNGWKKAVIEWRRNHPDENLTKVEFAPILKTAVDNSIRPETLKNGFRASGLYPFNPDAINYKKCLGKKQKPPNAVTFDDIDINMNRRQFLDLIKETKEETGINSNTSMKENLLAKIYGYFQVEYSKTIPEGPSVPFVVADCEFGYVNNEEYNAHGTFEEINNYDIAQSPFLTELESSDLDIANMPIMICDSVEDWSNSQNQSSVIRITHNVEIHRHPDIDETEKSHNTVTNNTKIPGTPSQISSQKVTGLQQTEANQSSNKKVNLQDTLKFANTPVRKGVKNTKRMSFVLTSEEWKKKEKQKIEEKQKKIDDINKRREERIKKQQDRINIVKTQKKQKVNSVPKSNRQSKVNRPENDPPTPQECKPGPKISHIKNTIQNRSKKEKAKKRTDISLREFPKFGGNLYKKRVEEVKMKLDFDLKPQINKCQTLTQKKTSKSIPARDSEIESFLYNLDTTNSSDSF